MTLQTKELGYYYLDGSKNRYIFQDLNLTFEKGVFYSILGKSGSGKTTLLSLLSALDSPKEGEILLDGISLKVMGLASYRRNKIGIVFQNFNLIPYMTAVENVMVVMSVTDNQSNVSAKEYALNLLKSVEIDQTTAERLVSNLSGGEQQRVAIARSLATNCDIIIADEPTGNLDDDTAVGVIDIFRKLVDEENKCVIMVTHSQEIATKTDIIMYLNKGSINILKKKEVV
ncbi:ABC transporter ATP-binding protein [Fundicoccus culcitae]|uniref:ABC transporter ATP-binding protein n=1 Tax=Fundicoccus culcitae TaxID=2969821 RepID=A0ABY5P3X2_9LACT|nr:ABC transporter ATP-binding protein [Fundicoccus culcitae]UUX33133.1 ABC transporter ATP-binding protein [Fundicoccus culcitae]